MNNSKLNNYFFVFDSDNFDKIKSKVYGFTISKTDGKLLVSDKTENIIGGCYIYVEKKDNEVCINQDELSSLYIYYYNKNGYWAVSNSFYELCKLLIEKGKKLTIRNIYIDQYIQQSLQVHSRTKSMVDEISIMECFSEMYLTKNNITIKQSKFEFNTVELLSKEGIDIIDEWIDKWASIMKAMYNSKINMQIDLSGGFDSRAIFTLSHYAGINLMSDNINVFSKVGKSVGMVKHLDNDYQIAEQISKRLGFKLNAQFKKNISKTMGNKGETQYEIMRNLFMFTHKEGYLCTGVRETPSVKFGGINGELVRRKFNWITDVKKHNNDPFRMSQDVIDEQNKDIEELKNRYKTKEEIFMKITLETYAKSHFGSSMYNNFIANIFSISPFNDKNLLKLKVKDGINPNIIFAIIIYRTTPEIFDIGFTSNRYFDNEVKKLTVELCNKFPKKNQLRDYVCEFDTERNKQLDIKGDNKSGEDVMYEVFSKNRELFINYISGVWGEKYANDIYEYANNFYLNKDNFFPNRWVTPLTSVIELLKLLHQQ